MSKRFFDISRLKSGQQSDDHAPEDGRVSKKDGKLISEAFSELSALSLDEMTEALRGLDGGVSDGTTKNTFTLEEIYGSNGLVTDDADDGVASEDDLLNELLEEGADLRLVESELDPSKDDAFPKGDPIDSAEHVIAGLTQDRMLEERLDDFMSFAPESGDASDVSGSDDEESCPVAQPDSPVSGIVKDEIVLSLLQAGVVNMSQVFDALRSRPEGMDLWRVLCQHPDTDAVEIEASVARQRGYAFQSYLDQPLSSDLISDVLKIFSTDDLARLVAAGLVPVALDLDLESTSRQYTLVVLSSDPLHPRVQNALISCPHSIECRYCPETTLRSPRADVMLWLREKGVDIATVDEEVIEPIEFKLQAKDEPDEVLEESKAEPEKPLSPAKLDEIGERLHKDRVVRTLLAEQIVTHQQAAQALKLFDSEGGQIALWRIIADLKGVEREAVYEAAARVYAFKMEVVDESRPDHDFVRLIMETLSEEHREEMLERLLIPFEHSIDFETGTGRIIFITPDPTRPEINKLVHELDLGRFELRYASESDIFKLLDTLFPRKNEYMERISEETDAFDLGMSYDAGEDALDEDALEAEISRSKLINLFEASLVEAVRQGTSDIHMFPNANRQVEIHLRTDGRLKKWHTEDKVHPEAFLAVVKDNSSNVDRFERDAAQDGFIQRNIDGALIRFRVSILPIASANQELRAESIVIRILDDRKVLTDITKLGMLDVALERFNKAIRQPHGMIILTGPTGSGKSTTLVAALYQVVTPEVNVLTVEDPVEYIIKGVRQIKLSHKLDLEGALRAILRHDPDIVMVGEMRDKHTAELAIKLANTGHLTFSTLHTNDAPAAVSRLYKMGVEPFLIAYAINLVVAQRLIREVCSACKVEDTDPDTTLMKSLGFTEKEIAETTIYKANRGSKCPKCNGNGYKGRRAVCETLYFTREIRNMIAESGDAIDEDAIRDQAVKDGMLTLTDSARELVKMGATTVEEMLRTTSSE
jgi:type IV pilus assembly protein PilB